MTPQRNCPILRDMTARKATVNAPPKVLTRNKYGLLEDPDINYVFNDNGLVDWRKMVDDKWLYPNPSSVAKGKMARNADPSSLSDTDLCIKLFGLKEVALIRGYTDVKYNVIEASADYVAMSCGISWSPNYETEDKEVYFEAVADAHLYNTRSFAKQFLAAIAENRAFGRCVRSFLGINVVGDFELPDSSPPERRQQSPALHPTDPRATLLKLMTDKNITVEGVMGKLVKEGLKEAEGFDSIEEIPDIKVFELIERLKNFKKK